VTEPAGHYLQFTYDPTYYWRISQVTASDGRSVNYYYAAYNQYWQVLDHVVYYNNANWTARYRYCAANINDPNYGTQPLLWTADDPMYPGPMKRIGYTYRTANNPDGTTPVYGQIQSENYYDGTNVGTAVSTLTVGSANPINHNTRTETRGDNVTRTFLYTAQGYVTLVSDFMSHSAGQTYDANKWINSVTDRNGHRTDFTSNVLTGNVTQVQFPAAADVTPSPAPRGTVSYTYGWANCPDPNNRDANNPYYLYSITDEGNHATIFTRDANKRVTRIDYPDGGYETFAYDAAHFYQLSSHRMVTGGTETFAYDGLHRRQFYSDPYHNNANNPSIRYYYDGLGRVNGVFDALWHPTNWEYNDRGQVTLTTLATDPSDNQRHTITNAYNADGTLQSETDQLGHLTSYTYDDYRRLKSVTPPARGDGTGTHTTEFSYHPNGMLDDYRYTDSNVTWVKLPRGEYIKSVYDDNRRKTSQTVAPGTVDEATSSSVHDNVGNLTSVTNPGGHWIATIYDERNRPSSINDRGLLTTFTYDTAGRRKSITRPNGQLITYDIFDVMNRVTQQTATQNPDPAAVTKYTYYTLADGANAPVGLLKTMKDPRLVVLNNGEAYTYEHDLMGRKTKLTYPKDSWNVRRIEQWSYDTAGRLQTFTNRDSPAKVQTFTYDALNRMTGFSWNDGGLTPSVSFGYDAASRLTSVNNANANISRVYYDDNSLFGETETPTGGVARSVIYGYDDDGNRATLDIPGYSQFTYTYTWRNQVKDIKAGATTLASHVYDLNGNVSTRSLNNSTQSTYLYDGLDRVTWITHSLNGTTRQFNYGYDTNSYNRKWVRRLGTAQGDIGDVFAYDLSDQVNVVQLNVANPSATPTPAPNISYDANGNRTWFGPYGSLEQYAINNLSQYTSRTIYTGNTQTSGTASYDVNGNMTATPDPTPSQLTCTYDAQNRVLSAGKGNTTMYFTYDGLNRQVSRRIGMNGTRTFSVWDGWELVQEYHMSGGNAVEDASYLYGVTGLVKNLKTNNYYYQDGSGSTSHLANSSGVLQEWYRYDLQGKPVFYNSADQQITVSAFGVRHLFTGQQWYSEVGLYDLRNRFYSPDLGRFLQPDPIGFDGDPTNLYSYCGNNPVVYLDPTGLFRGGQFAQGAFVGVVSVYAGIYGGAALSATGVGAILGVPMMISGVIGVGYAEMNIVGSFSNVPGAAEAQGYPSNLGGVGGRIAGGEAGQVVGSTFEDVITDRYAKTAFDKITSGISLALDAYDAGMLLGPVFNSPSMLSSLADNFSSRYVFQGADETGYAYFDSLTGREIVVGYEVQAYGYDIPTMGRNTGLGISRGSLGNYALGGLGGVGFYFEGGANYSGFAMGLALSYFFGPGGSLFGGGGGVNPCLPPQQL